MAKASKKRASKLAYTSSQQIILPGFETPFEQKLDVTNRWVALSHKIPWDILVGHYQRTLHNSSTGASGINPRVVLGAIIIKHLCAFDDRETVLQIQENPYMQYFVGLSSFTNESLFDPSLFVEFRKRLGADELNRINESIVNLWSGGPIGREPLAPSASSSEVELTDTDNKCKSDDETKQPPDGQQEQRNAQPEVAPMPNPPCQGKMIIDATACPQDIRFPTDLDLLNDAREKSEQIIDILYVEQMERPKPRTYREIARKVYLQTAQKKQKTKKEIRKAIRKQLNYLRRNFKHIDQLWEEHQQAGRPIELDRHQYKYLLVIRTLYEQQTQMFIGRNHQVEHRIVSIHQPHVRPIVRGKAASKVEFGAKINISQMNGFVFLEDLSWEAYNEGTRLMDAVERYRKRFGYYPKEVLADKIYCTRQNRQHLKLLSITLKAKPLGRPKAVTEHVSPGERNPIEGVFGQAKVAYGMNRIKARLAQTSESWIASIIMVLNLVKLAGQVPLSLFEMLITIWRTIGTIIKIKNIVYILLLQSHIGRQLDFFSRP